MSVMAGFDLVIEISPGVLRDFARANLRIGGRAMNPPCEMRNPFNLPLIGSGTSYLIVSDLQLVLQGERGAKITLTFGDSAIESDTLAGFSAYGLAGTATVELELRLVEVAPFRQAIGLNPADAGVTVTFNEPSRRTIDTALQRAGLGVFTWQEVEEGAAAILEQQLQTLLRAHLTSLEFIVQPGVDGFFANQPGPDGLYAKPAPPTAPKPAPKPPQFERLELKNIGTHAIGLFGSFLVADHARGDPNQKTILPLPAGQNIQVSISANAFHRWLFCPGLAISKTLQVSSLPASCGSGGPIDQDGKKLTHLSDRFENGAIVLAGHATESGTCYEANVSFEIHLKAAFDAFGSLVIPESTPKFGEPQIEVDWYCEFFSWLFGGYYGLLLTAWVKEMMEEGAGSDFLAMALALTSAMPTSFSVASVPNAKFHAVTVVPEAMTLGGQMTIRVPKPDPPYVAIRGAVSTIGVPVQVQRGLVHIKTVCIDGIYPVTEVFTKQIGVYWIETYLVPRPLHLGISLEAWEGTAYSASTLISSATVPANGTGTVTLAAASCNYPFPVPNGSIVKQPVHIDYAVDRQAIRFYNIPSEGNFGPLLRVKVTNSAGLNEEVTIDVPFVGDVAIIGGTYYEELEACVRRIIDKVNSYVLYEEVPPWVQADHPRPDEVFTLVQRMMSVGVPELLALAPLVALAHGDTHQVAAQRLPGVQPMKVDTGFQ